MHGNPSAGCAGTSLSQGRRGATGVETAYLKRWSLAFLEGRTAGLRGHPARLAGVGGISPPAAPSPPFHKGGEGQQGIAAFGAVFPVPPSPILIEKGRVPLFGARPCGAGYLYVSDVQG